MKRPGKIFIIPERDYEAAESALSNFPLSDKQREAIRSLIDDHKIVIEYKKEVIAEQTKSAEGIFEVADDAAQESFPTDSSSETQEDLALETEAEEILADEPPACENSSSREPESSQEKQKRGKKALPKGECHHHSLDSEEKICPKCYRRMTTIRSTTKTTVLVRPSIITRTDVAERCHCETCNITHTAELPAEAKQAVGRYHFSAIASFAALRYLYGMASYRLDEYSRNVGLRVSDSTQWHLFEEAASLLYKFVGYMKTEAANCPTCHVDDTHQLVLEIARGIEAEQEMAVRSGKRPDTVRSGIHTTNLTAVFPDGQLVLYRSGLHHAGEALASLLVKRSVEEQVVLMADASSMNTAKLKENGIKAKISNCNSHAVRKFKELAEAEEEVARKCLIADHHVSEEVDFFLRGYKRIFENESNAKSLAPPQRLEFHYKESLPIMKAMLKRVQTSFATRRVEPNGDVGKVYSYFANHWKELSAFCSIEGAPVCNNLSERMLKGVIRHRKNSLFFKNQLGAVVGDIFTSILMTAKANDLNPVEYLQNLLVHRDHWLQSPSDWLPWNYQATITNLSQP